MSAAFNLGSEDLAAQAAGETVSAAPVTVYVSIGNSDDKLTQADWARFVEDMTRLVVACADTVHGRWFSASDARWQNACWCLEFTDPQRLAAARAYAAEVRQWYKQDSVAWATARTEFL